jgi:hypothetical protein
MKTIISIALFGFLYLLPAASQQADYARLKSDAEQFYASGSYARANDIYSKVNKTGLAPTEVRWIDFRLADTLWRAQAATETADTTKFEQAPITTSAGRLVTPRSKSSSIKTLSITTGTHITITPGTTTTLKNNECVATTADRARSSNAKQSRLMQPAKPR